MYITISLRLISSHIGYLEIHHCLSSFFLIKTATIGVFVHFWTAHLMVDHHFPSEDCHFGSSNFGQIHILTYILYYI